jgi:acetyl-CoA carboxylase beta subunit
MEHAQIRLPEKSGLNFQVFENPAMFSKDRRLICPQCGESLMRADIEDFTVCPYCSHRFEHSTELEDFILEPEVDNWMKRQPGFTFQILNQMTSQD